MTKCARCGRHVSHPVNLGGMRFGARCAAIVRGAPVVKRVRDRVAPADKRQADLFGAQA